MRRTKHEIAGHTALTLDEVLTHPQAREMIEQFGATIPVGERDQLEAASDETLELLWALSDTGRFGEPHAAAPGDLPDWVRLGALSALCEWIAGAGSTCMHSPRHDRPEPVTSAAWRPGLTACIQCGHLFTLVDKAKDATCDGCGRITTGLANGDGIYTNVVMIGGFTWMYGVCGGCKHWDDTAPVTDTLRRPHHV